MMRFIARYGLLALPLGVLLWLSPAQAQEVLAWHGRAEGSRASLSYGILNTDYGPLSFSCTEGGDGLTFTYMHEPVDAHDGVEVEVWLQAGGIKMPIRTFGWRLELDDVFVLKGKTELDDRLIDILTSRGKLLVFVEDGSEEFPLEGAREAAAHLIEACRGQKVDAAAAEVKMCEISAWFNGPGPENLAIRAAPEPDAEIVATLPPPRQIEEFVFRTEMEISGFRRGWFRVNQAFILDYLFDEPTEIVFEGEGWVVGNHLGLLLNHQHLYEKPSFDAKTVADLAGPDSFTVDRLHACAGYWVEVEGHIFGKHHRGWTSGTCSNQVTTCP